MSKLVLVIGAGVVFWVSLALVAAPAAVNAYSRHQSEAPCKVWQRTRARCHEPVKNVIESRKDWEAWNAFARCEALASSGRPFGCRDTEVSK